MRCFVIFVTAVCILFLLKLKWPKNKRSNSVSFSELRSPWPAVGKRMLWEHSFWNNKGNNRILRIRFNCEVRSLHLWYLWGMSGMDAPRALVFRPLVKGNIALGARLPRQGSRFFQRKRKGTPGDEVADRWADLAKKFKSFIRSDEVIARVRKSDTDL